LYNEGWVQRMMVGVGDSTKSSVAPQNRERPHFVEQQEARLKGEFGSNFLGEWWVYVDKVMSLRTTKTTKLRV
jgi:hypothetical protein